jgi:hypothetical protein
LLLVVWRSKKSVTIGLLPQRTENREPIYEQAAYKEKKRKQSSEFRSRCRVSSEESKFSEEFSGGISRESA